MVLSVENVPNVVSVLNVENVSSVPNVATDLNRGYLYLRLDFISCKWDLKVPPIFTIVKSSG